MRVWFAAALCAAAFAPTIASAQRVTPTLSTSMQRTCQGESGSQVTFDASGQRSTEPQRFTDTRTFRAERAGSGYRFVQRGFEARGETVLMANIGASGEVEGATLSGAWLDAIAAQAGTPIDTATLAASAALDIPERLLINRSFAPGDDYYPAELRQTLIAQITAAMGVPFPVSGSIAIPFQGRTTIDGQDVLVWEGEITMSGAGLVRNVPLTLQSLSRVRVVHDAATGLVRTYETSQATDVQVAGERALSQTKFDNYVCQIAPQ